MVPRVIMVSTPKGHYHDMMMGSAMSAGGPLHDGPTASSHDTPSSIGIQ